MRPPSAAYPPRTLGNLSPRTLVSLPRELPALASAFLPTCPDTPRRRFGPATSTGNPAPSPRAATRNHWAATPPPPRLPPPAPESPTSRSQPRHQRPRLPPLLRIQQIHPIAVSCMHRNDHMRTTVRSLVNHRHSHTHRPAPHIPLSPGHTIHPPGRRPERHLQPNRIPITTSRPRHKLPTELHRIMKRHHRLQAIHPETLITGTIISLIHPPQEPIPRPNQLTYQDRN